ncbi:hypothetical protein PRIPAC_97443 [Pristionchus pacificus]|uniref:Nuclear receptor n=1 Tax=Pristionchus pacificus TaxID=54126 RepID=A0A2A6D2X6_PRIPA|nr:hypothetical protein PRIPAC_97443 [Pristionchus pacificus]|eukprot:PDM84749.1 nuclear receptor [Pristionchus pacificus]
MLCSMRRNSELAARRTPLHPSQITAGEYVRMGSGRCFTRFLVTGDMQLNSPTMATFRDSTIHPHYSQDMPPSTYTDLNTTCRFLLTGIIDLADALFPEFACFSSEEQWSLSVNFAKRVFLFDSAYRAEKMFPDDMSKCLGAYTSYMSAEAAEHFFDDCQYENSNIEAAKEVLKQFVSTTFPQLRRTLRSANLDEVEFHALLILIFWFPDSSPLRDEVILIGERYRQQTLKELQVHYKYDSIVYTTVENHSAAFAIFCCLSPRILSSDHVDIKMVDYAGRIGELFMLILNFDRSVEVDEQFEMFHLLGVFADDTFVYRLSTRFDNASSR